MVIRIHGLFRKNKHYVCGVQHQWPVKLKAMEKKREDGKQNKIDAFNRLAKTLIEQGISNPDFQKMMGISEFTRSQTWDNWKNRGLPTKEYFKIADILGLYVEWLATGKGEKYLKIKIKSNGADAPLLDESSLVPVVGAAQLGDNGHWHDMEYPVGHGDGYIKYSVRDKNAYALRCIGDSMKPRIRNGEFVIVEPNYEAQPGDDVMLKSLDGRVMVKTYLYTRDDRVHLMSINEAHAPQSFALSEVDKMHPIAGIANKLAWTKE